MKKAYLELILVELKPKKVYNNEVEVCDKDLTKVHYSIRPKKPTV